MPLADNVRQTIVVLTHFVGEDGKLHKVKPGKVASQAAHASIAFLTSNLEHSGVDTYEIGLTEEEIVWLDDNFTKIVLQCSNENELVELATKAQKAGLTAHLIKDDGTTVYGRECYSALAIGPHHKDKIDPLTKHLKLYR